MLLSVVTVHKQSRRFQELDFSWFLDEQELLFLVSTWAIILPSRQRSKLHLILPRLVAICVLLTCNLTCFPNLQSDFVRLESGFATLRNDLVWSAHTRRMETKTSEQHLGAFISNFWKLKKKYEFYRCKFESSLEAFLSRVSGRSDSGSDPFSIRTLGRFIQINQTFASRYKKDKSPTGALEKFTDTSTHYTEVC